MIQYDTELSERLGLFSKSQQAFSDSNNNENKGKHINTDKYSLRPRSTRRKHDLDEEEDDDIVRNRTNNKKFKQRPAPLSKYRRKTANARERSRMREINRAFETLRKVVPQVAEQQHQNEKLTKITTLRLAMNYIASLSKVLNNKNSQFLPECNDFDSFLLESDGESLALQSEVSDQSVTSPEFSVDLSSDSFGTMDFQTFSTDISELTHFDAFLVNFS